MWRATECSWRPVAAVLGIGVTGIVCALVASWAFDQLLVGLPGRRIASWWFGIGTLVNLLIGRLPFALGLALGLCALLALRRGHYPLALGLAAATMLGSPVAGAFLALAMAAWTLDDIPGRLWRGVGLAVACFGPYLAADAAVPVRRVVPLPRQVVRHRRRHLAAADRARAEATTARSASRPALHIVAAIATMTLQTPMGGNINRLTMFFAGPILAAVMPVDRRKLLLLVVVPLLHWQWSPSIDAVVDAPTDPTRTAEYYAPLVDVLDDLYADQRGGARRDRPDAAPLGGRRGGARDPDRPWLGGASSTWSTTPACPRMMGTRRRHLSRVAPPRGGVVRRGPSYSQLDDAGIDEAALIVVGSPTSSSIKGSPIGRCTRWSTRNRSSPAPARSSSTASTTS